MEGCGVGHQTFKYKLVGHVFQ